MSITFADLGVPRDLRDALTAHGIDTPTPIQASTIEDGLDGRDVCGRAPTGSGKTIAFGIPLVDRVPVGTPHRPTGLVLVPTRELASQVERELAWLGKPRNLRVASCFGGVGYGGQRSKLRKGVDVLVACPGRLADLVGQGDVDLRDVELVVVDEADRMADMGFLPEVRKLLDRTSDDRQTLLFSATLDGVVDALVKRYQHDPVFHELPEPDEDDRMVEHRFWRVTDGERLALGRRARSRSTVRRSCSVARSAAPTGSRVTSAAWACGRSSCTGTARRASGSGRSTTSCAGARSALVATDVAARGIHVDDVGCVVHFDPPNDDKDYTHRSGRTARAGASGVVISLVGHDQLSAVKKIQRTLGLPLGAGSPEGTPHVARDAIRVDAPAKRNGQQQQRSGRGKSRARAPRDPTAAPAGRAPAPEAVAAGAPRPPERSQPRHSIGA